MIGASGAHHGGSAGCAELAPWCLGGELGAVSHLELCVDVGEMSFLFAYWRGIPDNGYATLDIRESASASRWAVEDGLHLLIAAGVKAG